MGKADDEFKKRMEAVAEANRILSGGKAPMPTVTGAGGGGFGTGQAPVPPPNVPSYEGATLGARPGPRPVIPSAMGPYAVNAPSPQAPPPQAPPPQGPTQLPQSFEAGKRLAGTGPTPEPQASGERHPDELAPPPPGKPSGIGRALKQGAISLAGTLLGGPVGGIAASNYNTAENLSGMPAPPANEGAPPGAIGPPPPPEGGGGPDPYNEPIPIGWNAQGQVQVIPGHMRPDTEQIVTKEGIPVTAETRGAYGASFQAENAANEQQRAIDQTYGKGVFQAEMSRQQAIADAQSDHASIQAKRDEIVSQRLQAIDQANAQANAHIDSPSEVWQNRGAFARIIGAIVMGLGGFNASRTGGRNIVADSINSGVQAEINSQIANRGNAQKNVSNVTSLYSLHMNALDNQDVAVDAAKKGLFESALSQLEQERIKKGIADTDPNFLKTQSDILRNIADLSNKMQVQQTAQVQHSATTRWQPAQAVGGVGKLGKRPEDQDVITIPASDATGGQEIHVQVSKDLHKSLASMQGATNALVQLNNLALASRKRLREATFAGGLGGNWNEAASTEYRYLKDLKTNKVRLMQKAHDEGVTRESDYRLEAETGIDYTAGIGGHRLPGGADVEKLIQRQNNNLQQITDAHIRGATPQVVQPFRLPNGQVVYAPTGRVYRGQAVAPEGK